MRKAAFLAILGLFFSLTAGRAATPPASNWPALNYDAGQTNDNPNETTLTASNVLKVKVLWSQPIADNSYPIVAGGRVYDPVVRGTHVQITEYQAQTGAFVRNFARNSLDRRPRDSGDRRGHRRHDCHTHYIKHGAARYISGSDHRRESRGCRIHQHDIGSVQFALRLCSLHPERSVAPTIIDGGGSDRRRPCSNGSTHDQHVLCAQDGQASRKVVGTERLVRRRRSGLYGGNRAENEDHRTLAMAAFTRTANGRLNLAGGDDTQSNLRRVARSQRRHRCD